MEIALFLHLYQPPTQFPEVLNKIVTECYEPLFNLLEENPQAQVTVNMSASLTEQLAAGFPTLLAKFRKLCERRQVELVGTAAYHPILTRLEGTETRRQIKINEQINSQLWQLSSQGFAGRGFKGEGSIQGFFPPEMAVNSQLLQTAKEAGYGYVLVDEGAFKPEDEPRLGQERIFTERESGQIIIVRHRDLSLGLAFSRLRRVDELLAQAQRTVQTHYLVLAMDGETFGHHRPEQLDFLRSLLSLATLKTAAVSGRISLVGLSGILHRTSSYGPVSIQPATWSGGFERWDNPGNPIHQLQWRLLDLAVATFRASEIRDEDFWRSRRILDKALHSDQFWWASHDPCWHYRLIEAGATLLKEAVLNLGREASVEAAKREATDFYAQILQTARDLYGEGTVAC